MPTDECRPLLDRQLAIAGSMPIIELASPLLREVVNYSLVALRRCEAAGDHDGNTHNLVPLILFRHVIEMTDGLEVLIGNSCSVPAAPVLRSSFEACVSLEYILQHDHERRSLSWLCCYVHQKFDLYERLDPTTARGRDFAEVWNKEMPGDAATHPDVPAASDNLRTLLARPHMAPIETEYQSHLTDKRGRPRRGAPRWHTLFGGPANLRALAQTLERQTEYDALYGVWSRIAHGSDLESYIAKSPSGSSGYKSLRYPKELKTTTSLALTFLIRTLRLALNHYRHGEPNIDRWYREEVQPAWHRLASTEFEITVSAHAH
jgi:Family of unknown function (DUF5677)